MANKIIRTIHYLTDGQGMDIIDSYDSNTQYLIKIIKYHLDGRPLEFVYEINHDSRKLINFAIYENGLPISVKNDQLSEVNND
ncbi:DUF2963 domain-containing protein [Candidatus Phytoplasma prunorum]|uniref:DUF2963 domain-containing protein n=1 Tax=Candidatus Phytoplasma prunorum TaxID=47565 RepID=UPI002FF1491E